MDTAVVFGNREVRRQLAVCAGLDLHQRPGRVSELLSAKVIVVFNEPSAFDRPPDQVDFPAGRQSLGGRFHVGSHDRLCGTRMFQRQCLQGFNGASAFCRARLGRVLIGARWRTRPLTARRRKRHEHDRSDRRDGSQMG